MLSFGLLVIHIWVFTGITITLHRLSNRFGLTLLLFFIASLIAILNFAELMGLMIEPFPGILLRVSAHTFIPVILLSMLILYIANGTHQAQLIAYGVTGVNCVVLLVVGFMLLYVNLPGDMVRTGMLAQPETINAQFLRGAAASTVTFFVNMFAMIIFYQGMRNVFKQLPHELTIGLALIAGLWTDSILFNLLSNLGTPNFQLWLPGDILAKTLSGLVIAPLAAYYLTRVAPKLPDFAGRENRSTFHILFGMFGGLQTTLVQLRDELSENKITYQQLTDHIDEIFWVANTVNAGGGGSSSERLEVIYVSPAFDRIMGYSRERFIQNPAGLRALIHHEDLPRFVEGANPLLVGHDVEFRICREDENIRWLRSRLFPIRREDGTVYRHVGILEDMTERKQAVEREFALTLEQEKVRLLHDFVRDASHDLKSPLSAIKLKVAILLRVHDDELRTRHLTELEDIAMQLSRMIDDLFTLSRLESASVASSSDEICNLNPVIQEACEQLKPLAERRGLTFEMHIIAEAVSVRGSTHDIRRVVLNLIDNAIRYTLTGRIFVQMDADATTAYVEVIDSGMGIAPEDLAHIFNRFYRSENARKSTIDGTGLGLAIVKTIVERNGGTIKVTSQVGEGSHFLVRLPRATPEKLTEQVVEIAAVRPNE
jgi:PAS domain S-box-containing protein